MTALTISTTASPKSLAFSWKWTSSALFFSCSPNDTVVSSSALAGPLGRLTASTVLPGHPSAQPGSTPKATPIDPDLQPAESPVRHVRPTSVEAVATVAWTAALACLGPRPGGPGCGAGQLEVAGDAEGGDGGGQAALVHEGVVAFAEQGAVAQVGGSAVQPVHDVVGLAPHRWDGAAGVGAAAVPVGQGAALGGAEEALGVAEVEDLRGGAQHHGHDPGLAGDPAHRAGGEDGVGVQDPDPGQLLAQRVQAHGDHEGGAGGADHAVGG